MQGRIPIFGMRPTRRFEAVMSNTPIIMDAPFDGISRGDARKLSKSPSLYAVGFLENMDGFDAKMYSRKNGTEEFCSRRLILMARPDTKKPRPDRSATKREAIRRDGLARIDTHGIARNEMLTTYVNQLSIEMFDHGYFRGDLSWNRFGVSSPFARLYYMVADAGWLDTENGRVDLLPGRMYLIPAHTRVDLRTARRIEKFYFHFTASFSGFDLFEGVSRCLELPLPQELLDRLLDSYRGVEAADILDFQAVVHETVARFVRAYLPDVGARMALSSKYRELHVYVGNHLRAGLDTAGVARALGLSENTCARAYRKDTGITLNQYIHAQLVQRAAKLLLLTPMTVREVADSLGFGDEFYFSRFFKREMEYSPREYRRVGGILKLK